MKEDSVVLWDNWFIPLLADKTGQYILFNNKKGKNYGRLHLYSVSSLFIDKPISYYDSISAMIETVIKAYKQGCFKYNHIDEWLDVDFRKHHTIAKEINKKSKFWSLK